MEHIEMVERREAKINEIHQERLQAIIQNITPIEAVSVCRIMVRRYPEIVMSSITNYISELTNSVSLFRSITKELEVPNE